jgi:hypothetical protein
LVKCRMRSHRFNKVGGSAMGGRWRCSENRPATKRSEAERQSEGQDLRRGSLSQGIVVSESGETLTRGSP